ncbi:rarD protein [Moraxella macacae 0408225]|uniref:RarD protein n=1 Tax=Moraxella macacae 0408225 TaxID=1230338 RepID=L2F6V9_9GAMM|nr:EamA family transporter RarD [Moraxella macacae]ELA08178.1 rarD protein [Moraxella macacae 0408225]
MLNLTAYPKNYPKANFANFLQNHKILFGIVLALLSNVLFAVLYLYSHWLSPLTGTQVFLWRMVAMWFGLFVIMLLSGGFAKLRKFFQSLTTLHQKIWLVLPTPILASQLWLFMWAPVNGQAVNVAMGYFLFPLVMVVAGCLVFGERLSLLKTVAIGLAVLGVALQVYLAGSVSWATAWVCLTYPIYYTFRRWQGVPALLGLFLDLTIIAPFALAVLLWQGDSFALIGGSLSMLILISLLGVISAVAMQSNLQASSLLPVNLFGMLSYLEPALMFVLSIVVLNEAMSVEKMFSFGLIWAAVLVMIGQSLWQNKHKANENHTQ